MPRHHFRGEILLFITALIWGTSFVAQRVGMERIGPFTFTASRFLIGALSLLVFILITGATGAAARPSSPASHRADLLKGGLACGLALFMAISFQQFGLQYTSAGKAGFITALYILLVPVFGLFLRKNVSPRVWLGVILAITGLYLLTVTEGFSIGRGDLIVLCGTVFWAVHILVIDHFAAKVEASKLSFLQFLIAGVISAAVAGAVEVMEFSAIWKSAAPILYAGVVVVGIAYTLQVFGQKHASPSIAAIILSLESVFAVLSGMLLLGETLTGREIAGCILMFAAVLIAEIKPRSANPR
ncbi:MAG TPA: DMT family transporter [Anaerolineaceae bacterium]